MLHTSEVSKFNTFCEKCANLQEKSTKKCECFCHGLTFFFFESSLFLHGCWNLQVLRLISSPNKKRE